MRNCFVPKCDNICKRQPKRMMFLPPKKKEIYELWKEKLPKRKEFKVNDKVCERHFRKEDIITTFDHVINGQLFQMERGRPRLKPDAVPCLNLPSEEELVISVVSKKVRPSPKSARIPRAIKGEEEDITEILTTNSNEKPNLKKHIKSMRIEQIEDESETEEVVEVHESTTGMKDFDDESFETLYDDIFEVVLPNTLWGIHRDPDRDFIAFTCFDYDEMANNKSLVLSKDGVLKVLVNKKVISEQTVTNEMTHEFISTILTDIDEMPTCNKSVESDSGL